MDVSTAQSLPAPSTGQSNPVAVPKSLSFLSYGSIPFADGEGPSPEQEDITLLSSPYSTETVDTVIANPHLNQLSASPPPQPKSHTPINIPVDQSARRSLGNFEPIIRPAEPSSPPPQTAQDVEDSNLGPCDESQRLVSQPQTKRNQKRIKTKHDNKHKAALLQDTYQPGSCCFCLSRVSAVALFLWIFLVLLTIGWAVSMWKAIDNIEQLARINIRSDYGFQGLAYSDVAVIILALTTFLFSVVLVIISSYTDEQLSAYHFATSRLNKCGYCLSNMMIMLSSIAVLIWTLVIAITMIPTAVLTIIHILNEIGSINCVHLPSYGYGFSDFSSPHAVSPVEGTNITSSDFLSSVNQPLNETITSPFTATISTAALITTNYTESAPGINPSESVTISTTVASPDSSLQIKLHCGLELNDWLAESWNLMTSLLLSLGFAIFIEMTLMGFVIVSSSNSRHLKERMNYLTSTPASEPTDSDKHEPPFI